MYGFAGSTSSPTRVAAGRSSLRSSKRFAASSGATVELPVIFPPGRDMLATRPIRSGSPVIITMGMVVVAFLAASEAKWGNGSAAPVRCSPGPCHRGHSSPALEPSAVKVISSDVHAASKRRR
jgi:hypothetical protein